MHGCFTSRYMTCAYLKRTHCFLDVFSDGECYGFLRTVSPLPIGRTPGHLSIAISLQATKADSPLGSTKLVLSHLATAARVSHSSEDADMNEVQRSFHPATSRHFIHFKNRTAYQLSINLFKDDRMRICNWNIWVYNRFCLERLL